MERLQVIGLGFATLDVLLQVKAMPTWQHGGCLSAFAIDGGGPAGTAMVTAARLGARAGFVGVAGSDEAAKLKVRSFIKEGVDISHLITRPGPERNVVAVLVDERSGERVFCGLEATAEFRLGIEELDRDYLISAEYLLLDGAHPEASVQAALWMRQAGKRVVFDGGDHIRGQIAAASRLMNCVDVLIGGAGFVPLLTGVDGVWASGRAALRLGPRIVVQTAGMKGSYTVTDDEEFHTPSFQVQVVDTTGAGDVFHGAYIVGLLHGWDLGRVAQFASAVAALKCSRLGGRAAIPTFTQTLAFLRERDIQLA